MSIDTLDPRLESISFQQLKLFESVGRLKGLRRASEECHLSQPAVTQAIGKLERTIGVALIDRRACGSYLTAPGTLLQRRVVRFFTQTEAALRDAAASDELTAQLCARRLTQTQIRGLITIADAETLDRAAIAGRMSEQSLKRAVRSLEASVGCRLFYRAAIGVTVNAVGAALARRMALALREIDTGLQEIEALTGNAASEIVVGAMAFGGSMLLASALSEFAEAYPSVTVRILNDNAARLLDTLRAGRVDFTIGLLPSDGADDLRSEAFFETPYTVVARHHHPILRKGRPTVDDLRAYDWVVGTRNSSRRRSFEAMFHGQSSPRAPIATCSMPVLWKLLTNSDRLALITSYELMHERERLAAVPFDCGPDAPRIGVITRADWLPTALHSDFLAILRRNAHHGTEVTPLRRIA